MNTVGEQMACMMFAPLSIWPLTTERAEQIDRMSRRTLVEAGCEEESIDLGIWEREAREVENEIMDGYVRIATGTKPA